eukprot:4881725-Pleurochrysis_carterae.AAC.2
MIRGGSGQSCRSRASCSSSTWRTGMHGPSHHMVTERPGSRSSSNIRTSITRMSRDARSVRGAGPRVIVQVLPRASVARARPACVSSPASG